MAFIAGPLLQEPAEASFRGMHDTLSGQLPLCLLGSLNGPSQVVERAVNQTASLSNKKHRVEMRDEPAGQLLPPVGSREMRRVPFACEIFFSSKIWTAKLGERPFTRAQPLVECIR